MLADVSMHREVRRTRASGCNSIHLDPGGFYLTVKNDCKVSMHSKVTPRESDFTNRL